MESGNSPNFILFLRIGKGSYNPHASFSALGDATPPWSLRARAVMTTTDATKAIACVSNPSSIASIIHPCDGLSPICLWA
jgi:hypothetical protein